MSQTDVLVEGLTPLELRELESKLGPSAITIISPPSDSPKFHEPTTIIIISLAVSSLALTTLAIIATRPKKTKKRSITIKRKREGEDLSVTINDELFESGAPNAKVVQEISKALSIDLNALAKATSEGSNTSEDSNN